MMTEHVQRGCLRVSYGGKCTSGRIIPCKCAPYLKFEMLCNISHQKMFTQMVSQSKHGRLNTTISMFPSPFCMESLRPEANATQASTTRNLNMIIKCCFVIGGMIESFQNGSHVEPAYRSHRLSNSTNVADWMEYYQ